MNKFPKYISFKHKIVISTHRNKITDDPQMQLLQDPHDLPNLNKNN